MRLPSRLTRARALVALVVVSVSWIGSAQDAGDEPAPALKASALLAPAQLAGPHFKVEEAVETSGFFHEFTITSDFGTFQAVGRSQVEVLLQEI